MTVGIATSCQMNTFLGPGTFFRQSLHNTGMGTHIIVLCSRMHVGRALEVLAVGTTIYRVPVQKIVN